MRIKSQLTLSVFLLPLWRELLFRVRTAQEAAGSLACVCNPPELLRQRSPAALVSEYEFAPAQAPRWTSASLQLGPLFEGSSYSSRVLVVTSIALSSGIHKCGKYKCPKLNLVLFS